MHCILPPPKDRSEETEWRSGRGCGHGPERSSGAATGQGHGEVQRLFSWKASEQQGAGLGLAKQPERASRRGHHSVPEKRGKAVTHSQMATGFNHRWSNHTAHFAKLWRFHHITVATMSKRDSQRYWNQQQRSHNITQLQVGGSKGPILIKEEDGVIRPPTRPWRAVFR